MYELIQVSEDCFYINCPAKIGIVKTGEQDVCLIDSGNDKHPILEPAFLFGGNPPKALRHKFMMA